MPSPLWPGAHSIDPLPADFSGEHRAEAVPPEPDRLVADVDAALVEKILETANALVKDDRFWVEKSPCA